MKNDLHPGYTPVVFHDVSSDFKILTRSTLTSEETVEWEDGNTYPLVRVEISSASHPFYTGKRQQIAERGGRIEQFRRRYGTEEEAADTGAESAPEDGIPASSESVEPAVEAGTPETSASAAADASSDDAETSADS